MSIKKTGVSSAIQAGAKAVAAAKTAQAGPSAAKTTAAPSKLPGSTGDVAQLGSSRSSAASLSRAADMVASDPAASREVTARQARASSGLTDISEFDALGGEQVEPPAQTNVIRGQMEGLEEVSSSDGLTTYKDASGQEYTQRRYVQDGVEHLETTTPDGSRHDYASTAVDGATQRKTLQTNPDGSTVEVLESEKDGKIERVTTDTHRSDRNLGQEAGEPLPEGFADRQGGSEVSQSRTVVVDTTVDPPVERLVSEGRRVAQDVPIQGEVDLPDSTSFQRGNVTLSHNQVTTYDENGHPTKVSASGQELSVEAKREDGSTVSVQQSLALDAEGKILNETSSYRGFTRNELEGGDYRLDADGLSIGFAPGPTQTHRDGGIDYNRRGPAAYLNDSFNHEAKDFMGDGPIDVTVRREGEAESVDFERQLPNGDTRRVSRTEAGGEVPVYWSYGETTEGGNRQATQIVREGDPNFKSTSLVVRQPDGSFTSDQRVIVGNEEGKPHELYTNQSAHVRLRAEDVDRYASEAGLSPDQALRLKDQIAAGQPVFADTVNERFGLPDYDPAPDDSVVNSSRQATSVSGDGIVGYQEQSSVTGKFGDGTQPTMYKSTQAVLDREAEVPVRIQIDRNTSNQSDELGNPRSLSNDRYELTIDREGRVQEAGLDENVVDNLRATYDRLDGLGTSSVPSGQQSTDLLKGYLGPASEVTNSLAENLDGLRTSRGLGAFGTVMGLSQVWHGLQEGDLSKLAAGTSGTLGSLGSLTASPLLAGSKAAGFVTGLGVVGNVIGLGIGINDFVQGQSAGDKFKATLSIGGGIAGIGAVAAGTGPLAVPLGLIALGLVGAAFGYDLIRGAVTDSDPHPLDRGLFPSAE